MRKQPLNDILGLGMPRTARYLVGENPASGAASGAAAGSMFGPWGMALGAGLGAVGSIIGGQQQARAGRQARDLWKSQGQEGMNRLGMMYFGPDQMMNLMAGTNVDYGGKFWPAALEGKLSDMEKPDGMDDTQWEAEKSRLQGLADDWKRMKSFVDSQGGPINEQLRGFSEQAVQGVDDAYGRVLDRNKGAMARDTQLFQEPINSFQNATPGILAAAGQQSALAGAFGAEREGVIRRDADKMGRNLDARTRALMTASGFGGTIEAMQMAGNARNAQESMQSSLADLAGQKLGAQMQGAQAYQSALQGTAGTLAGLQGQKASSISRLGLQRNLMANNADQSRVSQKFNFQMQPLQSSMGILQSSVMNPFLRSNTSQFYPGQTATGALGQFGSQMGGSLFGMGMLDMMRK